jgi:phosphoribosylformylglycinamidine synthase
MQHLFLKKDKKLEWCFNIEANEPLTAEELNILKYILADGFVAETISEKPFIVNENGIIELGPRINFATASSTNLVAICHKCGLKKISRIEKSRRHSLGKGIDLHDFVKKNHDRMTECLYVKSLVSFQSVVDFSDNYTIPMIEEGPDALLRINGLAMDEQDRNFYYNYFVGYEKRNPTIMEIMDLNNANSEHSRHGHFKAKQIINGIEMPETLMDIVRSTLEANHENSIIGIRDNSSAIRGFEIWTIMPEFSGKVSRFEKKKVTYHILFTAESHNHPTLIEPFQGSGTGIGGMLRDMNSTGSGSLIIAATAGYCVGNLLIGGYDLPWEDKNLIYPESKATPLNIIIRASDGASDYGNKFGVPVICGFTRSVDQKLANEERCGFVKPILFAGGIGQIDDKHTEKGEPEKGMLIVQIGGPAYGVGFGGGAASSKISGENEEKLDFDSVQRGDAEMENKANRVIRACVEMEDKNPIVSIHDQGAGGPANVLKELVGDAGGRINLDKIIRGDSTLSDLKVWVSEYQERFGFLIYPDRIEEFREICQREKVNCEILGEVAEDGRFVVYSDKSESNLVDLDLKKVLTGLPQKTFSDKRIATILKPLELPENLSVSEALHEVLRDLAVGSKRFLTNKVDRSVTGLIAQQQCCGPLQLTVSNVAVIAQSHFGFTGGATAIGEQPMKMMVDPKAGARMAMTEALTNLVWAKITKLEDVKCSGNWMWTPKISGEGAALYDAATALRDFMLKLKVAIDGGKDSLSMAVKIGDNLVKSPRQLVISAYAPVPDIRKVITPDIKMPGESELAFINFSAGKARLGGSALARVYGQNNCEESPDVENVFSLVRAFEAIQTLIEKDLILSGHDISDGGLITTLLEMAFSGNCGLDISMKNAQNPIRKLFAEEAGLVIEYEKDKSLEVLKILHRNMLWPDVIGITQKNDRININYNDQTVLGVSMPELRSRWEETSYQLERLQTNSGCADEERENIFKRTGPKYVVSFEPKPTSPQIIEIKEKPEVAILREEGSNGDREMASAFFQAGFSPWDITMSDLIEEKVSLDRFRGLVLVGGFSYADVPESAKGWASTIRFNEKLKKMFEDFYRRSDTFSLGVCNGCQLLALLGWVPWYGIPDHMQPRFASNLSGRFESRWSEVKIIKSPSIMLEGMDGSSLGIWMAHGEGRLHFPDPKILAHIIKKNLAPIVYVDDGGNTTESYPFNPNGSPEGIAALCTPDGRHLAMMPHPERAFLNWQWPWMPKELKQRLEASPWLKMFQNAREWCEKNKK